MTDAAATEKPKQGQKRLYDEISVDVLGECELAVVTNAAQRFTKWERMRASMLKSLGLITGEEADEDRPEVVKKDPSIDIGEHCYIVAKVQHPSKDDTTVCLVEKPRNGGFVLMPESALKKRKQRCIVTQNEQQYSSFPKMEEAMEVKCNSGFKATKGTEGFVIKEAAHPTKADQVVVAVAFPSKRQDGEDRIVLIKKEALRLVPNECVIIDQPTERLTGWTKMAEVLGIEEKLGAQVRKGTLGVVKAERKHLKKDDVMVVGVELCHPASGCVMMLKKALSSTKS